MTDFTTALKDLDGKDIMTAIAGSDGQAVTVTLTLGRAIAEALLGDLEDEKALSGEDKLKRYLIASKVRGAADLTLVAEEVVLIKERIAKAYRGALVFGRVAQLLEPSAA